MKEFLQLMYFMEKLAKLSFNNCKIQLKTILLIDNSASSFFVQSWITYSVATLDETMEPLFIQWNYTPLEDQDTDLINKMIRKFQVFAQHFSDFMTNREFICGSRLDMNLIVRRPVLGFLTRSDTKLAVQPQKLAGGLKFWIKGSRGIELLKTKALISGYQAAEMRLCF